MKRIAIILGIIGIAMIILGIIFEVENKCKTIDKNSDFWVRNCDYE